MSDKVFWSFSKKDLDIINDYMEFTNKKDPNAKLTKSKLINSWLSMWANNTLITVKNDKTLKKKDMDKFKPVYEKSTPKGSNIHAVVLAPFHKHALEQLFRYTSVKNEGNTSFSLHDMSKMIQDLMNDQILNLEGLMIREKLKAEENMEIEEIDKQSQIDEINA